MTALAPCTAALALLAASAARAGPMRELGTVTVTAARPTSLPTQIPTTIEGITGGKQYNTRDNSDPNAFAFTGTSSFLVFDARVRCRIADRWTASLGIDNLGNEEYWAFHPYTQRTFAAELAASF